MTQTRLLRTVRGGLPFGGGFASTRGDRSRRGTPRPPVVALLIGVAVLVPGQIRAETTFLGPTPYLSAADSPFDLSGLGTTFFLEDFEDGELNTPGIVQVPWSPTLGERSLGFVASPGELTHSIDAVDGQIDGRGHDAYSLRSRGLIEFFSLPPITMFTYVFELSPDAMGRYPNAFGVVWTDYPPGSDLQLLVFDRNGRQTFGSSGPTRVDDLIAGTPADDLFLGAFNPDGISRVTVGSTLLYQFTDYTSIQVDHIQYGNIIPEPPTDLIACAFLSALVLVRVAGDLKSRVFTRGEKDDEVSLGAHAQIPSQADTFASRPLRVAN